MGYPISYLLERFKDERCVEDQMLLWMKLQSQWKAGWPGLTMDQILASPHQVEGVRNQQAGPELSSMGWKS